MSNNIVKIDEYTDKEGRIVKMLSPIDKKNPVKYNGLAILFDKSGAGMNFEFPLPDGVKDLEDAFSKFDENAEKALKNYEKERDNFVKDKKSEIVIPSGAGAKIIGG